MASELTREGLGVMTIAVLLVLGDVAGGRTYHTNQRSNSQLKLVLPVSV
jgi:hypothetical protein